MAHGSVLLRVRRDRVRGRVAWSQYCAAYGNPEPQHSGIKLRRQGMSARPVERRSHRVTVVVWLRRPRRSGSGRPYGVSCVSGPLV